MDDNSTDRACPFHDHRRPNSFQISNPSASDDHDYYDARLDLTSPPSSQFHINSGSTGPLPPLVVEEKRWRQRFFHSNANPRRPGDDFLDQRKKRSVSPPQYTADGFVYPGEQEGEEGAYFQEDHEEMQQVSPYRTITIPERILPNPHPFSRARTRHAPNPSQSLKNLDQTRYYIPNEMATRRPSVVFADIRPLSITRRRYSRQTHVQVNRHHITPRETSNEMYSRRHSNMQMWPCPETPSMTAAHTDSFSHSRPWRGRIPQAMGRSSSHDRMAGWSNTSSVLNNRRFGADAHRQACSQETSSSFSTRRYPPIRLAVHGLSYVDEDTSERSFIALSPRMNEPDVLEAPRLAPTNQHRLFQQSTYPQHRRGYGQDPSPESESQFQLHSCAHQKPTNTNEKRISRQPQRQPGMEARPVGGNRNFKRMPYTESGERDWSTDLCMFCDHNLGTCCKSLWCPCIIYGRNKARIEYLYAEDKVHPTRGGTCSDDCAIHACLTTFCLFGWAIQVPNRASIRRRYNIEGDWLGDCAAALFCSPCELSQESREIDLEERSIMEGMRPHKGDKNLP